ncbi:hypothetical protein DM860_012534 [Cuscuta australis]|uniref:Stomagen C-terminal domain-containing protein n=1 Tax=Cuscuta australis TaxID=267555 RepID=A0A328DHB8_9ASTE|nr:hypothetical protein DM860_012534 [Cuscuta australis]
MLLFSPPTQSNKTRKKERKIINIMAKKVTPHISIILLLLLLPLIFASHHHHHHAAVQGAATAASSNGVVESHSKENWKEKNEHGTGRRMMIGSVAPTCTYNECKGCKFKCRAEQVPVEGNDPINSPYHYKCLCHR